MQCAVHATLQVADFPDALKKTLAMQLSCNCNCHVHCTVCSTVHHGMTPPHVDLTGMHASEALHVDLMHEALHEVRCALKVSDRGLPGSTKKTLAMPFGNLAVNGSAIAP